MKIASNVSLLPYNTFGIAAQASYFTAISSVNELQELLADTRWTGVPKLILGGGSNMLFTQNFDGLVIKMNILGIECVEQTTDHVWVKAGAGEVWHNFVLHTLQQPWGGLENLSLIPGTVGAAPMQNIGAYGVEIKDTFHSLEAVRIADGTLHTFDKEKCAFGYRHSIFKQEAKGQYIITSVTFKLSVNPTQLHTHYGAIGDTLAAKGIGNPSITDVSEAVIAIRQSKLPDPAKIGNAGSFFKNPEIEVPHFQELAAKFPQIPSYPAAEGRVKVPAGWLIEQCGWKGKRVGNCGVHTQQALVIVNYGNASGNEIKQLSLDIQADVKAKFGIALSAEVNFI